MVILIVICKELGPTDTKIEKKCEKYRWPFEVCVQALMVVAEKLDPIWPGGMDYKKINVLIFCVAGPALFAASVALNAIQPRTVTITLLSSHSRLYK
jgi:hypothetical protein